MKKFDVEKETNNIIEFIRNYYKENNLVLLSLLGVFAVISSIVILNNIYINGDVNYNLGNEFYYKNIHLTIQVSTS